ncbi:MAG: preprotein translocase subunit SecG [Armatimonadota bacterium]
MLLALLIISSVTALGLIIVVALQTSKAESFSAAMGGADAGQFRKGTREELLARLTKYFAYVWIASVTFTAIVWYRTH